MMSKARTRRFRPTIGLRAALAAGYLLLPFAGWHLRRRRKRGKEDRDRWVEKLGQGQAPRAQGTLVWLHGVGLGEVLALRGLIDAMAAKRPDLRFLITYSTVTAGSAIARNLPERCQHQFLPLDLPGIAGRFLDHWCPDLAVWTDQEIWPRLASGLYRRGVTQAVVACRIGAVSRDKRLRAASFFRGLYLLPDLIEAQDAPSAEAVKNLSGRDVTVSGSLKPAAAALAPAPDHDRLVAHLSGRRVWLCASSHSADETVAIAAQSALSRDDPAPLLIIAPRDPARGPAVADHARTNGLRTCLRDTLPDAATDVWVADSIGELGSWYRIAVAAMIGGTFDATEGHNPWEAAALDTAILHGPRTANFHADFGRLDAAGAAVLVTDGADLVATLRSADLGGLARAAGDTRRAAAEGVSAIAARLINLMDQR